ncbi:MAG: hypothetical protein WBC73_09040, partial [Phormidesmis sp.]
DIDYAVLVTDCKAYCQYIDQQIAQHPEVFPAAISQGERFRGGHFTTARADDASRLPSKYARG